MANWANLVLLAVLAVLLMRIDQAHCLMSSTALAIEKLKVDITMVNNEMTYLRYVLNLHLLPGDGSWQRPARSCKEIMLSHPEKQDGLYFINPNGGKPEESIQVACNMTMGGWTIIHGGYAAKTSRTGRATSSQKKKRARKLSRAHLVNQGYSWASDLSNHGHEIVYEISDEQLKFLRALSTGVRQQVRFRCRQLAVWRPESTARVRDKSTTQFFGWNNQTFSIDDHRVSIVSTRNMCKTNRAIGKTRFTMSASGAAMELLPVRDFAVFNASVQDKRLAELEGINLIFM